VYQLLAERRAIFCSCLRGASGADIEDTVKAVTHYLSLGYKAIRAAERNSGAKKHVRVGKDRMHYEPAKKMRRWKNAWSTELYLNFAPQLLALRQEFGPNVHLLHDAPSRLTPIEAGRLGKETGPYHLSGSRIRFRGAAGEFPVDPAAHDDAARGGRSVPIRFTTASN